MLTQLGHSFISGPDLPAAFNEGRWRSYSPWAATLKSLCFTESGRLGVGVFLVVSIIYQVCLRIIAMIMKINKKKK